VAGIPNLKKVAEEALVKGKCYNYKIFGNNAKIRLRLCLNNIWVRLCLRNNALTFGRKVAHKAVRRNIDTMCMFRTQVVRTKIV
jgi:hypothetical protein